MSEINPVHISYVTFKTCIIGTTCGLNFSLQLSRVESVDLRITDEGKSSGTLVSGGKDGLLKYWDIHR